MIVLIALGAMALFLVFHIYTTTPNIRKALRMRGSMVTYEPRAYYPQEVLDRYYTRFEKQATIEECEPIRGLKVIRRTDKRSPFLSEQSIAYQARRFDGKIIAEHWFDLSRTEERKIEQEFRKMVDTAIFKEKKEQVKKWDGVTGCLYHKLYYPNGKLG